MNTFCVIDSVRKSGRPPPSTRTTRVKGRRSTARGPLGFLFRNAVRWPLGFFRKGSVGVVDFLPSLLTVRGETWYVHVSLTARERNWLRHLVVHYSLRDCVVFWRELFNCRRPELRRGYRSGFVRPTVMKSVSTCPVRGWTWRPMNNGVIQVCVHSQPTCSLTFSRSCRPHYCHG